MTNYEKHFGSPEAAAETILSLCENARSCESCVLHQRAGDLFCGDPLPWLQMADDERPQECESCRVE